MKSSVFEKLVKSKNNLVSAKESILQEWVGDAQCAAILKRHNIDTRIFVTQYASDVFDYFIGVISGFVKLGECPIMAELIEYLKNKELRADELFILCAYFKQATINATYRLNINDQEMFEEISYVLDYNLAAVLKLYTDTIYRKEQEAINAGKAKEYFLSNMSHEIRTPLNAILGFVALLKDEATSPRHQNYLDIISNSGENLLQIISDILDFSKLRSGEFTVDPQPFNIHDEISHTMELFVPSANAKSITLTSYIDPSIPYELIADALRINQIVGNFLSNAIKFSKRGGMIHAEARFNEGILTLSVRDEGVGIAPADQERIFDPFSQAQESIGKISGGTGLGLSICKQLAEHMGGKIGLESAVGKGSTFIFSLPVEVNRECELVKFDPSVFKAFSFGLLSVHPKESYKLESLQRYWDYFGLSIRHIESVEEKCDLVIFLESSIDDATIETIVERKIPAIAIMDFLDDRYDKIPNIVSLTFPIYCTKFQRVLNDVLGIQGRQSQEAEHLPKQVRGFKGEVLVAEDNFANQELIKILLERYGISCTVASNGLEALERYRNGSFDMILMDQQMPVMNGNDATMAIRVYENENRLPRIPIIALTANVIKGSSEKAIKNGYDAFLGKPIVIKEIEQIFERYLKSELIVKGEENRADTKYSNIDMEHLMNALMLEEDQVNQLLEIYKKKMRSSLQELKSALREGSYETLAHIAHSIKGSSANFRFEELSRLAALIEESALHEDATFDYDDAYSVMEREFANKFGL